MYTCLVCKDEYQLDEMNHYDINGEQVANDESSLERNAQNPDYASYCICWYCDEALEDYGLNLVGKDGTLSEDIKELPTYVEQC